MPRELHEELFVLCATDGKGDEFARSGGNSGLPAIGALDHDEGSGGVEPYAPVRPLEEGKPEDLAVKALEGAHLPRSKGDVVDPHAGMVRLPP